MFFAHSVFKSALCTALRLARVVSVCPVLIAAANGLHAQATSSVSPPARGTERASSEEVAQLKSGPPLPYAVDPAWPQLPKGYNFGQCSGVDVDRHGHVWVFNRGAWPVMEFDRAGKFLQAWSSDTFRVLSAHGLRVGPDDNLWCVDVDGHVIFKLNREGRVLLLLGKRQGVPGNNDAVDGFQRPTNVAFKAGGNVYISDGYVNSRVVEVTAGGDYVKHWGKPGRGDGEFNIAHDVAVDPEGKVYVADRANERIQVFDAEGKFLAQWTNLGAPWGLTYSPRDRALFMCDGKYNRIVKLSLTGEVLGTLGTYGKAPGRLDYAHSIAVDQSDGSIYTAEVSNARVQKWVRQ
ncbi:MAG TPA: peptidyl-alpha-hydroxyglycine alpha-amidating lyase family protein [Opitutaceae bacterium]|nr:peptidyl-alpha-hydroxyglycine alpha-amidating lyase family protein [Opitutaceae bacterium]